VNRANRECREHVRLERILMQKRASLGKLVPELHTEGFQRLLIAESRALGDLKKEHGCQR
jgi:hypothetical protein